jgi:hypothetical protein
MLFRDGKHLAAQMAASNLNPIFASLDDVFKSHLLVVIVAEW